MYKILRDTFSILIKKEKIKLRNLTIADILISVLDILFLIGLLYLVRFYTVSAHPDQPGKFLPEIFHKHPLLPITLFLLAFAVKNIAGFYISKSQFDFVYQVASRISKSILRSYLEGPYADYVQVDSSVINRRISQQPIEFSHYVLNGFQQIFTQGVLILITLLAVTLYNSLLFPLLLLIMLPPVLLIGYIIKKKLHASRQLGKQASEKSMQHLQEALTGFIESNTQGKNEFFTNRYDRFQSVLNKYLSQRTALQNLPSRMIEVFAVLGLFLLIVLNYFFFNSHAVQLVTVGALMIAAYKIIPGIVRIINMASQIKTYSFTTEGLRVTHNNKNESGSAEEINSLEFKHLFFDFGEKIILKGFSGSLSRGDMAGLSGMSGKGKTTFINILLAFLDMDSGEIKINDRPVSAVERKNFRSRISYAKQHPFLLHASVAVNITMLESGYDENKLRSILGITGLDKIIESFPEGLETVITENGKNFSGGQRQRFVLARALYRDFDLLILDEPFSELDGLAETRMLEHLQDLALEGKMILLITHRQEALDFCNKIFLLDET